MSFAHLLLKRDIENELSVEYLAVSPDFSEDKAWKSVARIIIDKVARDYEFIALDDWVGIELVDPKLYALPEAERAKALPVGAACGAWTGRIHDWTMRLIQGGRYPATFPP